MNEAHRLTKRYSDRTAVEDVSFTVMTPWTRLSLIDGYAAALLGIAAWLLKRRDAWPARGKPYHSACDRPSPPGAGWPAEGRAGIGYTPPAAPGPVAGPVGAHAHIEAAPHPSGRHRGTGNVRRGRCRAGQDDARS